MTNLKAKEVKWILHCYGMASTQTTPCVPPIQNIGLTGLTPSGHDSLSINYNCCLLRFFLGIGQDRTAQISSKSQRNLSSRKPDPATSDMTRLPRRDQGSCPGDWRPLAFANTPTWRSAWPAQKWQAFCSLPQKPHIVWEAEATQGREGYFKTQLETNMVNCGLIPKPGVLSWLIMVFSLTANPAKAFHC